MKKTRTVSMINQKEEVIKYEIPNMDKSVLIIMADILERDEDMVEDRVTTMNLLRKSARSVGYNRMAKRITKLMIKRDWDATPHKQWMAKAALDDIMIPEGE